MRSTATTVGDEKTSKNRKASHSKNLPILLIMSTAYIAVGINTQGFKAMLPLVRADFGISAAEAGLYTTFFFLSGTLLALLSGSIVDRLGPKKGLVGGTLVIGTVILIHSVAPVFYLLLALAFLTGMGFSIITPSINKGVMELVHPRDRAFSLGLTQSGGGIGGILGAGLLPLLGELFGWRSALLVSGSVALLMSFILTKFYHPGEQSEESKAGEQLYKAQVGESAEREGLEGSQAQEAETDGQGEEPSRRRSFKEDMKILLSNKVLLTVSLMGFVFGLTISNVTTHYTMFLTGDVGFTPFLAGISLSMFMFGGVFGKPSLGYLNDKLLRSNRRVGLYLLGVIVSVFSASLGLFVAPGGLNVPAVLIISFVFGFFSLGITGLFFTAVGDVVSTKMMGTATGLALIFIRSGVVTGPPIIGYIADVRGDYQVSWLVLSAAVLLISTTFFVLSRKYQDRLYGGER